MTMLFLKAQVRNANTPDLFAVPVVVAGHVAGGHVVAPYVAIRHKAPPEVSHPKAIVVVAHPKHDPWRAGVLDDPPGSPPAPTRNFSWDAVKLSNAYSTAELNAMYRALARDPAGRNPGLDTGSIFIYTPATRKKMDAITWAITYHLKDKNHEASGNRDGSFKPTPLAVRIEQDVQHVQAVIDDYKAKQAIELERGPGNNAAVYDPMIAYKEKDKAGLEGIIAQLSAEPALPDPGPPMVVTTMPAVDIKAAGKRKAQADKLREAADKIIAGGEDSLGRDRLANTRKRAGQAASAIQDAQKEIQLGETMRNLAAAVESGDARLLAGITSRAGLEMLVGKLRGAMYLAERGLPYAEQQRREGRPATLEDIAFAKLPTLMIHRSGVKDLLYELERADKFRTQNPGLAAELTAIHGAGTDDDLMLPMPEDLANRIIASFDSAGQSHAGWQIRDSLADIKRYRKMGINTDEQLRDALTELLEYRTGKRTEDPIKAAERALVGTKPGIDFFPTPPPLAQRMVQLAGIQPGDRVLEPSAGKGDIADAIRAAGGKVDAVELSATLRNVLTAKGHALVGQDFETFEPTEPYDVIVMNPPWSGGADVRHVRRAYDMLKPGGRLVALMSMHPSFAQDKASVAFRGWMEELGASSAKIPAADFASQWMSGGIPSWLVRVERPMVKALFLLKAQIKGAGTADLFAEPVRVKAYVRDGHTVQAHTEVRQVHHEAPPAPKPAKSWEIIGAYVTALLAGEPSDMAAAAAALDVGETSGLADHQINRLRAFLEGKMPKAAVDRIATKVGMTFAEWTAAVKAEQFKAKAVVVNRGAVPAELSAAAASARAARDRAQAEYQSSREWVKTDPQVRMLGGLAHSKIREAVDKHAFHAASEKVRAADAAIASRPAPKPVIITKPPEDVPSPGMKHFYVSAIDGKKPHLVAGPYASLEEAKSRVEGVRRHADTDPRAHFMAWGTAGSEVEHKTPLGKWAPAAKPIPVVSRAKKDKKSAA